MAIIGGSRMMHGAPLFAALAAEASGADLVFVCLPRCHEEVAKTMSLNFQVMPFQGDDIAKADIAPILELLATMDSAVLGPGIVQSGGESVALQDIIAASSCKMILDATALQKKTLSLTSGKSVVLTPHLGELERMGLTTQEISLRSKEAGITIVLKCESDRIAMPNGEEKEIQGGNAGLTVGGTGDTLAGLIAGLTAQGESPPDAACMACTIIKRAGSILFSEYGYSYTAADVIEQIPHLLHTYEE